MLNPEYLVQKAERVLQSAPFTAFMMGLGIYCKACAEDVTVTLSLIDNLNSLQLDECKASKALVATIASPFSDDPNLAEPITNFAQSTGATDLWTEKASSQKANQGQITEETDNLISSCSTEIKSLFAEEGYVFENIASELGYPEVC